jgi:hypothetical protein
MRIDAGGVFETISADKPADRKRICAKTGLTELQLIETARGFENGNASPVTLNPEVRAAELFTILRRPITAKESTEFTDASPVGAVNHAFLNAETDHVCQWDGKDRLCCLDVDYHHLPVDNRHSDFTLLNILSRVQPAPFLAWISPGRGMHLLYHGTEKFSADELAACAGLAWLGIDPTATFEVLSRTRVPQTFVSLTQTTDPVFLGTWLRNTVTEDQIDAYLVERGFVRGEQYDHTSCPLSPGIESHGRPVWVGTGGIFCHKCDSLGVRCGNRKAGFFPYSALLHGGTPSVVRTMAEHFAHYEHAKLVLADTAGIGGSVAESAYRALLRLMHGDDPRIARVFTAGNNMVRLDNRWGTRDALAAYDKQIQPILAALPACQTADGKVNHERVSRFTQNIDLSEYGYPAVTPIRGLRIYSHRLAFSDGERISVVVPSGVLRSPANDRFRPRYVPVGRRLSDPWAVVERSLPGVNRQFVRLLIAAKGIAEGQVGLPPNVLVCGPTAAGKSTMTTLAAALCGDHNTEIPWQKSMERFRQGVADGADKGTFVTVNEVLKDAERSGTTPVQALDVFLNLTPDSVSHKLYVGPVPLGRVPVCVVTDTLVPTVLRADLQLARRFVYVRLGESHLEWVNTLASSGLYQVQGFRVHSEEYAAAADAIVSEVIDDFFDQPRTLTDIAKLLGFPMLDMSPDFDDPTEELRKLYDAVCNAPELSEKFKRRWPGEGWKSVQLGDETPLADAWEAVNDGGDGEKWFVSRRADSCDWRRLLRTPADTRFETRRNKGCLAVRFRCETRVNGEITNIF